MTAARKTWMLGLSMLVVSMSPKQGEAASTAYWDAIAHDVGEMWNPVNQTLQKAQQTLFVPVAIDGATIEGDEDELPVAIFVNGAIFVGDKHVGNIAEATLAPLEFGARLAGACAQPGAFFLAVRDDLAVNGIFGDAPPAALQQALSHAAGVCAE